MKRVGSTAERLRSKSYEHRVCMVENYAPCLHPEYGDGGGPSVEQYVDYIHQMGQEVQVIHALSHEPSRKEAPLFQSRMMPLSAPEDGEAMRRFIELAHERDIMVMAYYQMSRHQAAPALKDFKTEWLQRLFDQRVFDHDRKVTDEHQSYCLNSPYRDWLPEYLKEFIEHLDVDGFYFDGTNWGSHKSWPYFMGCCCTFCDERFKRDTGLEIPVRVDFDSEEFRRFLAWRNDTLREFMAHVTRKVRETYPAAVLSFNHYPGVHNCWSVGHPMNPLGMEKAGGGFFVEMGPHDVVGLTAKYVRAHGAPTRVFIHSSQPMDSVATHLAPYPETAMPAAKLFSVMANGVPPIFAMLPCPSPIVEDFMKGLFSEVKRRVPYMDGETVKYTALHMSQQARDLWRPDPELFASGKEYYKRLDGTYEMLDQSHLLSDVVFDEQLTAEYLAPYRVLVLSNSACLSDGQCEAIRSFVRDGGTLIATHETSLEDELGRKREGFGLADVFGVSYRGPAAEGEPHGVIYVPQKPQMGSIPEIVICTEALDSEVTPAAGCDLTVLATRCSLKGKTPLDWFDPRKEYDSGEPAVVEHAFGKGKAIYISADVGAGFTAGPYPPLRRFVAALVGRTASPIDVEAPVVVKVTAATRESGELMVHLVNYPVSYYENDFKGQCAPFVTTYFMNPEEVVPVHDIRITFNDCRPKRAWMPLQDRELEISGDPPAVVVPKVHLHEVILLEV